MKKAILISCFLLASYASLRAQQATSPEALAQRIAQRIKDTLNLSHDQQQALYTINMQLHNQKMEYRRQYGNNSALGTYLQQVENTRDSLYKAIIPTEKFGLYKQKKRMLVNNNPNN